MSFFKQRISALVLVQQGLMGGRGVKNKEIRCLMKGDLQSIRLFLSGIVLVTRLTKKVRRQSNQYVIDHWIGDWHEESQTRSRKDQFSFKILRISRKRDLRLPSIHQGFNENNWIQRPAWKCIKPLLKGKNSKNNPFYRGNFSDILARLLISCVWRIFFINLWSGLILRRMNTDVRVPPDPMAGLLMR